MKSLVDRSAIIATALLLGSLMLSARPLVAETLNLHSQQQQAQTTKSDVTPVADTGEAIGALSTAMAGEVLEPTQPEEFAAPASPYVATAYSLRGRTASGVPVARGLIAADPKVLPLGSRVRLEAGFLSGEYLVADTGGAIRGKRVDIWTPTGREAFRFGRRTIRLTVLSYGPKRLRGKKASR